MSHLKIWITVDFYPPIPEKPPSHRCAAAGGACAQRLAARLIPRFLHCFPDSLDAAATVLISLSECRRISSSAGENDEIRATVTATRCEALQGLATVCGLAAKAGPAADATVTKVANFLLRCATCNAATKGN